VSTYYSSMPSNVSNWNRLTAQLLIFQTHRNVLPMTNSTTPGIDDVWGALADVDAGMEPGTVRLIFSDTEIPQQPFGVLGWLRYHLFPISRGVGQRGPDLSDIHNIRPDTYVTGAEAASKYFGACMVLTQPESCVIPAQGAANDTCSCNRVFEPPANVKGDIARALMYMDLRYNGREPFTRNLRLTDCPFEPERDMAYLSQMLTWHKEDPPDALEIARNDKVCANWQGNRNPFIDFPGLADVIFQAPSPLPGIGESLIYDKCQALPTLSPTFAANQCDMYDEGDFMVWLFNSNDPISIGLYSFSPIPEGFELFITDNPWDGEKFLELDNATDGTIKVSIACLLACFCRLDCDAAPLSD